MTIYGNTITFSLTLLWELQVSKMIWGGAQKGFVGRALPPLWLRRWTCTCLLTYEYEFTVHWFWFSTLSAVIYYYQLSTVPVSVCSMLFLYSSFIKIYNVCVICIPWNEYACIECVHSACSVAGAARGDLLVPDSDLCAAGVHDSPGTRQKHRQCAPNSASARSLILMAPSSFDPAPAPHLSPALVDLML